MLLGGTFKPAGLESWSRHRERHCMIVRYWGEYVNMFLGLLFYRICLLLGSQFISVMEAYNFLEVFFCSALVSFTKLYILRPSRQSCRLSDNSVWNHWFDCANQKEYVGSNLGWVLIMVDIIFFSYQSQLDREGGFPGWSNFLPW